jgi:hypothetical protein
MALSGLRGRAREGLRADLLMKRWLKVVVFCSSLVPPPPSGKGRLEVRTPADSLNPTISTRSVIPSRTLDLHHCLTTSTENPFAIVERSSYCLHKRHHGQPRGSPLVPQPNRRPFVFGRSQDVGCNPRHHHRAVRKIWQCFQAH